MSGGKQLLQKPGKIKNHKVVTELEEKKRGRPAMLPENVLSLITKYIHAIRGAGGIINTAVVISYGTKI